MRSVHARPRVELAAVDGEAGDGPRTIALAIENALNGAGDATGADRLDPRGDVEEEHEASSALRAAGVPSRAGGVLIGMAVVVAQRRSRRR
jgi:hypothetical protein